MIGREDYTDVGTVDAEDRHTSAALPASVARYPDQPDPLVYRGVLGDLVRAIEPHSEADPVAVLMHALVAFGSVIGRNAYFIADGARHYGNLFCVVVATSSKGRKGTAWKHASKCFESIDPDWRVDSGLSSGEGLIWSVRDPSTADDTGVTDKRLLVLEQEFAKVLRVIGREGSTLSAVVREAWDSGKLSSMTKASPATATGAHVAIMGHITADELRRYLTATEAGNGFGNRFLWVCARRSKYLPDGGTPDPAALADIGWRVRLAVEHARSAGELRREAAAAQRWRSVYRELSDGRPGLLGSMTGRAEAQVMRLALLYALTDASKTIDREHLDAALALWDYCLGSARFIFGEALGDHAADDLRVALTEAGACGLSRAEMSREVFGRNRPAREIVQALSLLHELGLARCEVDRSGGGRPVERWYAVQRTN